MHRSLIGIALLALLAAVTATADESPGVRWRSLDDALAEAETVGKPVMIHFTAEWCGWCKKMKREVYTRPEVAAAIDRDFVPAIVDTDRHPELKARYGVRGLPTIWFLSSEGAGITYVPGYVDAPTFGQILRWVSSGAYVEQDFDEFTAGER